MVLMPASIMQSGTTADVQTTPGMVVFGGAGGRSNEGRLTVDGGNVGASLNGAGVSGYVVDILNAAEVVTTNSGGLGESEVGGPTINIVPKTGGNSFHGSAYAADVRSGMTNTQLHAGFAGRGPRIAASTQQTLGRRRGRGRADHEGPILVLHQLPQ